MADKDYTSIIKEMEEAKIRAYETARLKEDAMRKEVALRFLDPLSNLEKAMQDVAKIIEGMYEWGTQAKDPLGNFMPKEYGMEAKEVYRRLRAAIDKMISEPRGKGYPGIRW